MTPISGLGQPDLRIERRMPSPQETAPVRSICAQKWALRAGFAYFLLRLDLNANADLCLWAGDGHRRNIVGACRLGTCLAYAGGRVMCHVS